MTNEQCDICEIEIEQDEQIQTIDDTILCFGCDAKQLEQLEINFRR